MEIQILAISDDAAMLARIRCAMAEHPCRLETAAGTEVALRWLQGVQPDVILLHLAQSDWEGSETVGHLRDVCDAPLVVLGSSASVDARVQLLRQGADLVLSSTVGAAELWARLDAVLRRRSWSWHPEG